MGKVKISQEQADLVEQFKRNFKGFGREILIEVIKGRYEIELKFKEGDIVNDGYGRIREVSSVGDNGIMLYTNHENSAAELFGNQTDEYKQIRHAKDEVVEIYKRKKFWNENGRKVWELKEGDVLNINDSYESIKEIYEGEYIFESGITEEVNNFNKLIEIGNVEVICFVHDRKDIKND